MKVALLIDVYLKPRTIKIAKALIRKGVDVSVICEKNTKEQIKSAERFYNDLYWFDRDDYKSLTNVIKKSGANICHIFSEAHISEWIEQLVTDQKREQIVIFDQYDNYRGFVTDAIDSFSRRERCCIEQAEGICKRNFEADYLKEFYGYTPQNEILFLDYCWGDLINFNSEGHTECEELNIVYGGRLLRRDIQMQDFYLNSYKIERAGIRFVARMLKDAGGYFNIIPTVDISSPLYSVYRNIEKMYSSVIIRKPMTTKDLIVYESKMDYGIDCLDLEEAIDKYGGENQQVKRERTYYATNKFFDYLDAGIMPIYGRNYEKFGKYLEDSGAAYYCTMEDMPGRLEYLRENRNKYKNTAKSAAKQFYIENQIQRLIDFYKECR